MTKYPENTTVWVSRVVNGFREVSVVDGPKSLWTKPGSGFGVEPSRCKVLEKLPGDLSKTEVIKLLQGNYPTWDCSSTTLLEQPAIP